MSRLVIHRLVIPVLQRICNSGLIVTPHLENWLEERLKLYLSACGAVDECKQLEERLQQLRREDPEAFERTLKDLLDQYRRLAEGPPDRFSQQRKKALEVWRVA